MCLILGPEKEYAFLVGLDRTNTIIATPDAEVLFKQSQPDAYAVAKREDIMNCTLIEDVDNLVVSQSQTIRARNFIPVPPFLVSNLNDLIVTNKANTNQVFLDVITEIKVSKDDDDCKEKVTAKCKQLLHWLYVETKDERPFSLRDRWLADNLILGLFSQNQVVIRCKLVVLQSAKLRWRSQELLQT